MINFLKSLRKHWPGMFRMVVAFALAQVFFMYKAVETVPFFLYNMYSTRQRNGDTSYHTSVYLNGRPFDVSKLSGHEEETLFGSLSYFKKLKANRFFATDSATVAGRFKGRLPQQWYGLAYCHLTNTDVNDSLFLGWWARYLSQVSGQQVDSFTLVESTVVWTPAYHLLPDTVSLINYHRATTR